MDREQLIDFMKVVEKFKTCKRSCRTTDPKRSESDAEHSWHLALFLMLLESELSGVDRLRLLKLALIHDLPELYAGDTNPYRDNTENKAEDEKKAAKELFSLLPQKTAGQFSALFDEYMTQGSVEAKIVKSADKLMPLIQNLCTNHTYSSYRNLKVTYAEVERYMDQFFQDDDVLFELYQRLLSEAHANGVFYDSKGKD